MKKDTKGKLSSYDDLATRWGIAVVSTKRRVKQYRGVASAFGKNNALLFGPSEVARIEREHKADEQKKLTQFAEAA